jgi:DNA-binding transcriptional LysR family regulator
VDDVSTRQTLNVTTCARHESVHFITAGGENDEPSGELLSVEGPELVADRASRAEKSLGGARYTEVMYAHHYSKGCTLLNTLRSLGREWGTGMQSLSDRGVPPEERHDVRSHAPLPDWEGIRIFLEVIRCGSFRSASDHLGQSVNALRRRIEELEHQLNTTLITRHVDGVRITPEGEEILEAAKRMELVSFELIRARDRVVPAISGEVRLAVTEGLGMFWIAPRVAELHYKFPRLLIDLSCAMKSADVLRLEADIAVQLTKPSAPDLKVVRLGRLHVIPFAGKSYVETYGVPRTKEEFRKHRLVLQVADQTQTTEIFERLFPGVSQHGFVAMRTNASSTHVWAIENGVGIGWAPTYLHAIGAKMLPVDVAEEFRLPFDIWLTYHADAGRIPRVRKMIDWIVASFDPRKFPWFRDEFIHPDEMMKEFNGNPQSSLFEGLLGQRSALTQASWSKIASRARAV